MFISLGNPCVKHKNVIQKSYRRREDARMESYLKKNDTFDHLKQCGFSEVSLIIFENVLAYKLLGGNH